MLREGVIYVSPSTDSAKLSNIGRGREVAVMERTPGWVNVMGTVGAGYAPEDPETETDRNVTGWIEDKGVITTSTPDGDKILFGEAFDCEMEASKRGGRRGAAQDAMRLYARIAEYFPQSPLAAESAYRAADIRWQIESADAASRPSAKERDPALHYQIDEDRMKQVIKKYPHTKWADLAAYHLIENKLCGDWEAEAKCPEMEASALPQVRRRASAVAQDARSALQSGLALLHTDRDLQNQAGTRRSLTSPSSARSTLPRN